MTTEEVRIHEGTIPAVPGVLSASDVLATAHAIADLQQSDGMIPWFAAATATPGTTSKEPWRSPCAAWSMKP